VTEQILMQGNFLEMNAVEFGGEGWHIITDPPYSPHVHANATSCGTGAGSDIRDAKGNVGTRKRDLGFDALTEQDRAHLGHVAATCGWTVIFSDVEGSHLWRQSVPRYVRTVPWIRWSMPQLSGDRPPQGFENVIAFSEVNAALTDSTQELVLGYKVGGRMFYNGPGNLTHFDEKALRGSDKHRCEKPLDLCCRLVEYFTHEGDTVFDPYAGSGAIGLACRELGRNYVGVERDAEWAEKATQRLLRPLSERDAKRFDDYMQRKLDIDRGNVKRAEVTRKVSERKRAAQ
jgi:hypothetical protein